MNRRTFWVVQGMFRSLPDAKGKWEELESYSSYGMALKNATNIDPSGMIVRGYHEYRIIKRTCIDEIKVVE